MRIPNAKPFRDKIIVMISRIFSLTFRILNTAPDKHSKSFEYRQLIDST